MSNLDANRRRNESLGPKTGQPERPLGRFGVMMARWLGLSVLALGCEGQAGAAPVPEAQSAPASATLPAAPAGSVEAPDPAPAAASPSPVSHDGCPPGMAWIASGFCIDRWEAITVLEDGSTHSPYHAVGPKAVRAASRQGEIPQAYISLEEADLACKRAEKRLCTTQQWLDACEGTQRVRRKYPHGSKLTRGACHVSQRFHPTTLLHDGRRKTDSWSLNDPRINQIAATIAPTGAFEACVTPEGVHDLHGNLLEWTRGERPLAMGGHYLDGVGNGVGCKYVTSAHNEQYHDFTTGFRCCRRPDRAR